MDGHGERSGPGIGELAKDSARDKIGVLMGRVGGRVQIRPVAGGREWETEPDNVEYPTAHEEMRARNSARNRMTRLGL